MNSVVVSMSAVCVVLSNTIVTIKTIVHIVECFVTECKLHCHNTIVCIVLNSCAVGHENLRLTHGLPQPSGATFFYSQSCYLCPNRPQIQALGRRQKVTAQSTSKQKSGGVKKLSCYLSRTSLMAACDGTMFFLFRESQS